MSKETIDQLKNKLIELSHLKSALALLSWDQEVNMPPKGGEVRAKNMGYMAGLLHEKFLSEEFETILKSALKLRVEGKLDERNLAMVREVEREFNLEKKLPADFVKESMELIARAQMAWVQARKNSDFKFFAPFLSKIVEFARRTANYLGYKESPYDALLDVHEPGLTAFEASQTLNELKNFLVPFIQKIKDSKIKIDSDVLKGNFPKEKQEQFNREVIKQMGFDLEAGRVDVSTHPFAMGLHPHDVRLTTRYYEENMMESLTGIIHETGHGLYEQGLPMEDFGSPLGEALSLGIHESQSRMWENIIGKSLSFWKHFYPKLQKQFPVPFKKIPLGDFHKIINRVSPSLIRTEADEVTYNLHVILRFEIEKGMLEGNVKLENLPKIWKEKMKEYLDIDVPNNTLGVLQDVHWSTGGIGYFPTYSLGNLYSAQFYAQMKKDIPNLDLKISKGRFDDILVWLRKNIHSRGKTYKANDLAKKVTGEYLTARHWNDYIKKKYGEIYALS